MDLIGKIHPASPKGQNFILVDIDYFTVGGGSTIEESRTERYDSVHQGEDYS